MVSSLTVGANAGWVDTGIDVPAGAELHVVAARVVVFGSGGSTVWGVAADIPGDPGGIYLGGGNMTAYPEGTYADNSIGRSSDPGSCSTSAMGGATYRLAADSRPFCLAMKVSSTAPGWNSFGTLPVERRRVVASSPAGRLWLCFNEYQNGRVNSGFYAVAVAVSEPGKSVHSGLLAPGLWSSGIPMSGPTTFRFKAVGLWRTADQLWWFPEGGYGSNCNTDPAYSPGDCLTSYSGQNYPALDQRPFCFVAKPNAIEWGATGTIAIERGKEFSIDASGTLNLAWNASAAASPPSVGGWLGWVAETETILPPPAVYAAGFRVVGNPFVRFHNGS